MVASGSQQRRDLEKEVVREKEFVRITNRGIPEDTDALLDVLSVPPHLQVPEGYGMSLTSGRFADYKPQITGFADYSHNPAPGETLKHVAWVEPVGPFPPLGTSGPVVPANRNNFASRANDGRLGASKVPGTSVIEIGSHSAIKKRTVAMSSQVQKKPTPPSIYPCVKKARQIKDRLDLVGTTQVMKNLELSSIQEDEEMAPKDMAVEPARDDDDVMSIDSQPESHKRPRSPVADDERENSEFVQILESPAIADQSHAERQKLDWAEEMDLFGDTSVGEDPCVVLTYEDTLIPVPKVAFPHFDKHGKVHQMCIQKAISFIQPNLNKYVKPGKGMVIKACSHFDVIGSDEAFYLPQGYCLVDQGSGLEMHYGEIPRVEAPQRYFWAKDPKGVWILQWKIWEGSLNYTDEGYAQECAEDSILGRLVPQSLTSESAALTMSTPLVPWTSSVDILLACISAENRYLAHRADCLKCKSGNHQDWVLDSGASEHYTNNRQDLVDFELLDSEEKVLTASSLVTVKGRGTSFLTLNIDGKTHSIRLHPVYYIPGFKTRLLSMGSFLQNGHRIKGDCERLLLISSDGKTSIEARPHGYGQTIYWVNTVCKDPIDNLSAHSVVYAAGFETWHQRLGHPSNDVLRKASAFTKNFPSTLNIPKEPSICTGCAEGKMPSASFPMSDTRAKRAFELVHSDVKSFPIASYHKYRYFVSFLDDYSSYCWVVFLKTKDEVLLRFKQFVIWTERQYSARIGTIMSDFGGEYKSLKFDKLVKDLGIEIRTSAPRTPQQNGRAERLNRTIMDKAEAMRHYASLPPSWWEFSVGHAVYVY
jgi:hypothetical protein